MYVGAFRSLTPQYRQIKKVRDEIFYKNKELGQLVRQLQMLEEGKKPKDETREGKRPREANDSEEGPTKSIS